MLVEKTGAMDRVPGCGEASVYKSKTAGGHVDIEDAGRVSIEAEPVVLMVDLNRGSQIWRRPRQHGVIAMDVRRTAWR